MKLRVTSSAIGICRTDVAIDERARIRLREERAVVALLISLWCVLIFGHFLSHLGGIGASDAAGPAAHARLRTTTVRLDSGCH